VTSRGPKILANSARGVGQATLSTPACVRPRRRALEWLRRGGAEGRIPGLSVQG